MAIFGAPSSTPEGDRQMHPLTSLYMEFNSQQLLFEAFLDIMHIFGSVVAQSEYTLPFLYVIIFQCWQSLETSSLLGKIDVCVHWLFCTEFHARQLLFKAFLDITRIFGNADAWSEYTLPFLFLIIFQRWHSLEPHNSTPGGGRHMCPWTFLYGIQCSTTLTWSIFGYIAYFWQCRDLKWIYLAVFVAYNFSKMVLFFETP